MNSEVEKILHLIPKDHFFEKRKKNYLCAVDREVFCVGNERVSTVFVNKILGVKFVTWMTAQHCKRQGYATILLSNFLSFSARLSWI